MLNQTNKTYNLQCGLIIMHASFHFQRNFKLASFSARFQQSHAIKFTSVCACILLSYRSLLDEGPWQQWGYWSQCSVSCGRGNSFRTRDCSQGLCHGHTRELRDCKQLQCGMFVHLLLCAHPGVRVVVHRVVDGVCGCKKYPSPTILPLS